MIILDAIGLKMPEREIVAKEDYMNHFFESSKTTTFIVIGK